MADQQRLAEEAKAGESWYHGSFESTESLETVVEEEYFQSRYPDLAGDPAARRAIVSLKRRQQRQQQQQQRTPSASPPLGVEFRGYQQPKPLPFHPPITPTSSASDPDPDPDVEMADASQPLTQQATQPYENHRRLGKNLSDISEDDATDVICLLHPSGQAASQACKATMLHAPEHILQNDDLDGITEEDMIFKAELQRPREFALRMSSTVKRPQDGFRFGRNPALCDVLLTSNVHDKLISNVHFKIFVNSQGSLMLQDMSTNGTIVDDEHLRKQGLKADQHPMRALKNGAIISVVAEPSRQEIKLLVRIPNRGDNEEVYERKLKTYLERRGKVAAFASMRENAIGNHWNGGSLYNFTGVLGKGAFALVYRVQTKREGTYYAAKELDKRRFYKNGILDTKFDSELKIMKDLKHPNIVEYIDCQQYQYWIYIIMEYIPCGELSKELQDRKFLPEAEVQQIAKQIMRALDYLHRRGITHRDIKPDNILIASRDPLIVKLSDFGLSKCVNDQETFLKTFCGTLLYCAPEVYPDYNSYMSGPAKRRRRGEPAPKTSPYDQSVDMWSFGAVLFHVLCGKPPIMGRGDDRGAQMLTNIMTKDVDYGPLEEKQVSDAGRDFIYRLLNKNPLLRPRERECLEHAWLRDVPDVCEYNEDDQVPDYVIQRRLDAVEELDEDLVDEALMQDLNRLTQHPASPEMIYKSSPERPMKKPRTNSDSITIPPAVAYPQLPDMLHGAQGLAQGPLLFGEISPSLLKSSGVFADQLSPQRAQNDIPEIRSAIEQVSVDDRASSVGSPSATRAEALLDNIQNPHTRAFHIPHDGAAPSLLGAEAQIGQLNMASPEAVPSDGPTPDTTHPITPQTREISPSSSLSRRLEDDTAHDSQHDVKFSRRIDANLLHDEVAFAASIQARDASRNEKRMQKAETFQIQPFVNQRRLSTGLATTMNATRVDLDLPAPPTNGRELLFSRTINPPGVANRPLTQFGSLTPVPGSCGNPQVIPLDGRLTSWGRGADCTIRYHNSRDTRIPKYAIKMTFWAKGIEKCVEQGGDWIQVPGIRTLISTSTSHQIWVNDIELRKESADGKAALYGQVYNGDIITVHEGGNPYEFLKYKVEITFGDSARSRPEKERPFVVQKEIHHHRIQQERESLRNSHSDGERGHVIITTTTTTGVKA